MHRELSRALKVPHWGIFSGRDVPMGLRTCGYRIGLRPLGGACPLRPLRLLWISVSAAGGGHLHSKPFSSPMVHKRQFPQKQAIKKYPAASCEVFCGAPCGSKPEHFCLSGRHRHHTTAHPEVMLLFLRARIKEGC